MAIQMAAPINTPPAIAETTANRPDTTQTNIAGYGQAETNDNSAIAYIVAWTIVFLILALFNRSRVGHAIIYYLLALALFVLLVVNYQAIVSLIAPASGQVVNGPDATANSTTGPAQEASSPSTGTSPAFSVTAPISAAAPRVHFSSGD